MIREIDIEGVIILDSDKPIAEIKNKILSVLAKEGLLFGGMIEEFKTI